MTKIQVLNSRTRKWISQTISILAANERNLQVRTVIPVLQTQGGSEELRILPKVTQLVMWQGQILKLNLLALKAVYTVPKTERICFRNTFWEKSYYQREK